MEARSPAVLLALTQADERALEEALFGPEAGLRLLGSASEGEELVRLASETGAEAALLSPEFSGLSPALSLRLRATGLRLVGFALDEQAEALLAALGIDRVLRPPLSGGELTAALGDDRAHVAPPAVPPVPEPAGRRAEGGAVLAVVGGKGAPGASECAASLAALAHERWPSLLVELDALGGSLDLRLGADARQGSLLGLAKAARAGEAAIPELLERWLSGGTRGWPPVLLGPPEPERSLAELARPGAVATALRALGQSFALSVCDLGWLLAEGAEVGPAAHVHREALVAADAVLLVLGAREEQLRHGLLQLARLLDELALPAERLRLAVSGLGAPGAARQRALADALAFELAERGLAVDAWLPFDGRALAIARRRGLPLACARRRGSYARALERLLGEIFVASGPARRLRRRRLPVPVRLAQEGEEVALPWRR